MGLSVVSWFFECLGLYVILQGLGVDASLRTATLVRAATLWLAVGLGATILFGAFRGEPGPASVSAT